MGITIQIRTALGVFRAIITPRGVAELRLPTNPAGKLARGAATPAAVAAVRRQLERALRAYAAGRRQGTRVPLDIAAGTAFQREVWRALQAIPHGETRSYAWVARRVGRPRATRAVGAACGANPVPVLVPCHRVVASDGSLGGFSGGLGWKNRLLALEQRAGAACTKPWAPAAV